MKGRFASSATAILMAATAAACGNRLSHERLLTDAAGGARATVTSPVAAPAAGDIPEAPVTDPAATSTPTGEGTAAPPAPAGGAAPPIPARPTGAQPARTTGPAATVTTRPAAHTADPAAGPSSSNVTSTGGPGCSQRKSTITIGTVGEQSGVLGQLLANGPKTVAAWVAAVNAGGGLACHPVRYVILDDGGDPSRNQALVRRLVEEERALALVHANAPLAGGASVKYLTDKRIPVIGSETASPWFYSSPMFFPQASSADLFIETGIAVAASFGKSAGKKLATISCVEVYACSRLYELAPQLAAKHGLDIVYRGQASLAAPDFTAQCQSAQSAGAKLLIVGMDSNSVERVARSCNTVNYRPQYILYTSAASAGVASNPLLDGVGVGMNVLPWVTASHPGIAEFRRVLKQHAPGLPLDPTPTTAWVSAKLFERAARKLPEAPTPQSILDGLWSIANEDLGGLTMPLAFSRDANAPPVLCYWTIQVNAGQYSAADSGQRTCG